MARKFFDAAYGKKPSLLILKISAIIIGVSACTAPPKKMEINKIDLTALCGREDKLGNSQNADAVWRATVGKAEFYFCETTTQWEGPWPIAMTCRVQAQEDVLFLGFALEEGKYRVRDAQAGRIEGVENITDLRRIDVCAKPLD